MTNKTYNKIRDAVWLCLIENNIKSLPIPPAKIANHYNIHVLRYSQVNKNWLKDDESGTTIFM